MEDKVDGQAVAENGSGEQEEPKKVKSYRIKENMTGKDFYKIQVDTSSALEQPFNIQRPDDEDVRKLCELCQIVEEGFCCPDHCCDVSITITLFFRFSYFFNFLLFISGIIVDAIVVQHAKRVETYNERRNLNRSKILNRIIIKLKTYTSTCTTSRRSQCTKSYLKATKKCSKSVGRSS